MTSSRLTLTGLLVLGATLGGCSAVDVRTATENAAVERLGPTYAWADARAPISIDGVPVVDPDLLRTFREYLDERLAWRGYTLVRLDEAEMEASFALGVTRDVRDLDPYFAFYRVERIERGHIGFVLSDVGTGEVLWSATGERELRVTERGYGQMELQYEGTEEQRDWQPGFTIQRLLETLPRYEQGAR
ncbi:MAG: hypothetical protein AAGB93_06330 [Planctomycetota bacterium]